MSSNNNNATIDGSRMDVPNRDDAAIQVRATVGNWPMSGVPDGGGPLMASDMKPGGTTDALSAELGMRGTSEALADALSSSLATIAASGNERARANKTKAKAAAKGVARRQGGNSSEEGGGGTSSSSSSGDRGRDGSGPAMVTANTTTSSGDDAGTGSGSGSGAAAATNSSSDDRGSRGKGGESGTTSWHYHHHNHRQRKRPPTAEAKSADDYGLPVPVDDRLRQADDPSSAHAAVVAEGDKLSGDDPVGETGSLLQPHREPGFHKIRTTFKTLVRRDTAKSSETDSSGDQREPHGYKVVSKRASAPAGAPSPVLKDAKGKKRTPPASPRPPSDRGSDNDDGGGSGNSSGSGTEGGYAGSASSNENGAQVGSCSSPSVSSSEESVTKRKRPKSVASSSADPHRPLLSKKQESTLSVSSEIADFSSGGGEGSESESASQSYALNAYRQEPASESPSITSSSNGDGSSEEEPYNKTTSPCRSSRNRKSPKKASKDARQRHSKPRWLPMQVPASDIKQVARRKRVHIADSSKQKHSALPLQVPTGDGGKQLQLVSRRCGRGAHSIEDSKPAARPKADHRSQACGAFVAGGKPPILSLGCDIMAHVLTFLEPPDIQDVLTMPLSKDWIETFTRQPELWRVLCLLEPFKARVEEESDESSDDSLDSFPLNAGPKMKEAFGKFRLLYTSFVRCMRYLARIKDDAVHGRPPSVIDYGGASSSSCHRIGANQNLQHFLARARGVVVHQRSRGQQQQQQQHQDDDAGRVDSSDVSDDDNNPGVARVVNNDAPIGVSDDGSSTASAPRKRKSATKERKKKKVKYGHSLLTQRLLGPGASGEPGNVELPWSCAIYSIVNWMSAFSDVEGIQTMCLKVLPFLLEDEQQRITAQRAGLTDVVLRDMVMFPESSQLHTAAFHTIVLLARPLGGREGMLFHTSMVNSSGIFSGTTAGGSSHNGKNGIAVMLDSMKRFRGDEILQAMSCWSLVNIALAPAQKEVLVKLGGIEVTAGAMLEHPRNAEVQFRALFALINLVIPSVTLNANDQPAEPEVPADGDDSEREMLGEMVNQIVHLVVLAMKNFCSSEAILNRACLVLHNLSLTGEYHTALLWTPNCYQMLEWCLANYRTDQVLQQSAAGTLHRLQLTLSGDESLAARFHASLQAQQQLSLEQAHREAIMLHEQQERQQRQIQEIQEQEARRLHDE